VWLKDERPRGDCPTHEVILRTIHDIKRVGAGGKPCFEPWNTLGVSDPEPDSIRILTGGNSSSPSPSNGGSSSSGGGCYVATAVYGDYDCPEVWTLRRYRDYTLAKNMLGRAFIRSYYFISPMLVKCFGETRWFKNFWKSKLDRMVAKLHRKGVEDTPYTDLPSHSKLRGNHRN
jgi:hypothetical protein